MGTCLTALRNKYSNKTKTTLYYRELFEDLGVNDDDINMGYLEERDDCWKRILRDESKEVLVVPTSPRSSPSHLCKISSSEDGEGEEDKGDTASLGTADNNNSEPYMPVELQPYSPRSSEASETLMPCQGFQDEALADFPDLRADNREPVQTVCIKCMCSTSRESNNLFCPTLEQERQTLQELFDPFGMKNQQELHPSPPCPNHHGSGDFCWNAEEDEESLIALE